MLHLSETSRPAWSDGSPLPFGTLTFYAENTHELLDVYDAEDLGAPLTNPVEADSDGIFPDIWLDATLRYGVALHDRYGRLIYHVPAYRTPVTEGAFKYLDAQIRSVDGDGRPIPGDTLTLTDDEEAVVSGYADPECTVPLTNPIVADAGGLFPAIYRPDPQDEPAESTTKLLLHFDENVVYSGSNVPIDSAEVPNTVTKDAGFQPESQSAVAKFGSACTNHYAEFTDPISGFRIPATNFDLDAATKWTIEAFIYLPTLDEEVSSVELAILRRKGGAMPAWFGVLPGSPGAAELFFYESRDSDSAILGPANSIPQNEWVHVAVCRDGTQGYLFVNGVLGSGGEITGNTDFSTDLQLWSSNQAWPATGTAFIDELRVVVGEALYTSNFTPPSAPFDP